MIDDVVGQLPHHIHSWGYCPTVVPKYSLCGAIAPLNIPTFNRWCKSNWASSKISKICLLTKYNYSPHNKLFTNILTKLSGLFAHSNCLIIRLKSLLKIDMLHKK